MDDVLLVHPEQEMQLVALLSRAGFYVQLAYSSGEAMSAMHRHQPTAVIIGDGPALSDEQELLSRLRAEFNVAIITLGSRDIYARALAMGRLGTHPSIVAIFDLGETDGQPYTVIEMKGGHF